MKKLIIKYKEKINNCDEALEQINLMMRESRKDSSIDTDDLREEKNNCNANRQIYVQFVKDLESVNDLACS